MKRFLVRRSLLFALFFQYLLAMNNSDEAEQGYYKLAALNKIKSSEQMHAPCMVINQLSHSKDPNDLKAEVNALVYNWLAPAIAAGFIPIIASPILVYAYQHLISPNSGAFNRQSWRMYDIADTNALLLLPKEYRRYLKKAGLRYYLGKKISQLTKNLVISKNNSFLEFDTLKKIFAGLNKNPNALWDFFIIGHGNFTDAIAGMHFKNMQALLHFLNRNVNTGIAHIVSCCVGGCTSQKLCLHNDFPVQHQFPLSITGLDDCVNCPNSSPGKLKEFYEKAAVLKQKKESLKHYLQAVAALSDGEITSMPQLLLPHWQKFGTLDFSSQLTSVTAVKTRVLELENKPVICGQDCDAALLYPAIIKPKISVSKSSISTHQYEDCSHFLPPSLTEIVRKLVDLNYFSCEFLMRQLHLFPILLSTLDKNTISLHARFISLLVHTNSKKFPVFYSMAHDMDIPSHHIAHIDIAPIAATDTILSGGVFTFLKDAFFIPLLMSESTKIFCIDTLTGPNDIALSIELNRLSTLETKYRTCPLFSSKPQSFKILEKMAKQVEFPLATDSTGISYLQQLLTNHCSECLNKDDELYKAAGTNKTITLRKVRIIGTRYNVQLSFELDNYAWYCHFNMHSNSPLLSKETWRLYRFSLSRHIKNYEKACQAASSQEFNKNHTLHVAAQKSLVNILLERNKQLPVVKTKTASSN